MEQDRISYFEKMIAENPDNPTGLLALANEYGKAERFEEEAAALQRYVAGSGQDDEGNAYLRLGEVLTQLEREEEAKVAYLEGIKQAGKFGHDGMVEQMRAGLESLE